MSPEYKLPGGYINTDPYYVSPEDEATLEGRIKCPRCDGVGHIWGGEDVVMCPLCKSDGTIRDLGEEDDR